MEKDTRVAIYPGSFDPITLGHLNLIRRISRTFARVTVLVTVNAGKNPMFTVEERYRQVSRVVSRFPNVVVEALDGLVAEYARNKGSCVLIRGLRALSDFERECEMAIINKKINPDLDTFFLAAEEKYMYLSSSGVRELALYGADLSAFAPCELIDEINEKAGKLQKH